MAEHYCPVCGALHGEAEAVSVETEPGGDVAETAIEAMAEVSTAAIEAVVEMHGQEEQTEQVEAVTEALETVAEEQADVAIVEALADDGSEAALEASTGEMVEHEEQFHEVPPGEEEEPEPEEDLVEDELTEPTPVSVPPQLDDRPSRRTTRTVPAFRRHRMHR